MRTHERISFAIAFSTDGSNPFAVLPLGKGHLECIPNGDLPPTVRTVYSCGQKFILNPESTEISQGTTVGNF